MKTLPALIFLVVALAANPPLPAPARSPDGASATSTDDPVKLTETTAERFGETFNEGLRAFDEGRPKRAYDLWLSIAVQGDLAAMRNLAHLLQNGIGVEVNVEQAAIWYSRAAKRGLTSAQVNLAALFHEGNGVPQDYKLAAQWYAKAARAGHAHAQYKLARMIEAGQASAGNLALAKKLYGWAIDAGHSGALESLRQLDARPGPVALIATPPRGKTSLAMEGSTSLKTLAGAGDTPGADNQGRTPDENQALIIARQKFTEEDRGGAVAAWRSQAMKSVSEAQYRLALALLQGHGVNLDSQEALHWLDIAATGGHADAARLLHRLQ